jgi:hypothetical protein
VHACNQKRFRPKRENAVLQFDRGDVADLSHRTGNLLFLCVVAVGEYVVLCKVDETDESHCVRKAFS